MICPNCQTDNREDAKYCNECGFELRPPTTGAGAPDDDAARDAFEENAVSEPEPCDLRDNAASDPAPSATCDDTVPSKVIDDALREVKSLRDVVPPIIKIPSLASDPQTDEDETHRDDAESDEPRFTAEEGGAVGETDESGSFEAGKRASSDDAESGSATSAASIPNEAPDNTPPSPDSVRAEAQSMFGVGEGASAEVTADFTGLERLVDSSYVPPAVSGRSGDTMEFPRIEDEPASRAQSFRAQADRKEQRRQRKAQRKMQREQAKRERELRKQGATDASGDKARTSDDNGASEHAFSEASTSASPSSSGALSSRDDTRASSKRGPIIGLVVLLIVVALVAAGTTYYLEMWGGKTIPDVSGQSQADALSILEETGFVTSVELVKSDDVEGLVIDTDPAAGQRAEEGTTVTVRVSTSRIVPDVAGKTQSEVEELMEDEGLVNVTYQLVKSNETEGTALSVEPAAGERVTSDEAIVVSIAQSFVVPDVSGATTEEAVALLEAEGYVVSTAWYNTEELAEGTAVSTDPEAGSKHPTGSEVVLYVAHNRSTELVNLTRSFLIYSDSPLMTIGGTVYRLDSSTLQLSYAGDNTVNFTVSGTEVGFIFGIAIDNPSGPQSISGTVAWDDDNNIVSTYPAMRQGA